MHARSAAQRLDFKPRIVRERPSLGVRRVIQRFLPRRIFERQTVLFGRGRLHAANFEIRRRQLKLAQLPGVRCPAVDNHDDSNRFWIATNSSIPLFASATSEASCTSSNAVFSAVACNSTNLPDPVMTTFISTSACESSW